MDRNWLRRQGKRLLVWLVAAGIVASSAGIVYFETPYRGTDDSVAAVHDNPDVTVTRQGDAYVLEPAAADPEAGLVFYPGARVHPDAYLAALAPLVSEANVTVVIPSVPLNFALLGQGAASGYVTASSVDTWYVGGHSLGGVAACRYADANRDRIDGLVLFASYCDRDISGSNLSVLTVAGSADTVLDRAAYERNRRHLPPDAAVRELPLNHTQFGSYRGQPGDEPSGLDYAVAHDRLANVTITWVRARR